MNKYRKQAIIVGILFIIATAAPLLSTPFISPVFNPGNTQDYLVNVAENTTQVTTGALLEVIMALAIAGIAITLYPVLKKYSETLAMGYVVIRTIEGVIFIVVAVFGLLSMVTLSQEFVKAGAPSASHFQTLGTLLTAAHDWAYIVSNPVFSLSALILNYVLYRSKFVPRFISVWGMIGTVLLLAGGLSGMFSLLTDTSILGNTIYLPLAVQEMVFAVWLIVKGFNLDYLPSGPGNARAQTTANIL